MARYMGRIDVCRITIPLPASASASTWPEIPVRNFVDELVQAKWKALNLVPSPLADDATFLRRAFLDAIGTLPTPDEVRAFLADPSSQKRSEWIDKILARGEYADFWAIKWGDLLRNQRKGQRENQRGTFAFHAWIRNALATNMPYDQFVRSIIAAQGTVDQHPPVIWYRTVRNLTHQTNDTAQLFLGTRINCAQCHNHPYEKWTQDDYYRFQAFFARLGKKSGESSAEPAIFVKPDGGGARNPTTGKVMKPHGLDGPEVVSSEDEDPRQELVDWMAAPDNPFFARALANRLWGHFMGRGLVEPIDDMRVTNPPSNPELLDALAHDFVAHKFDVKHLIRTIMDSSAYQLVVRAGRGERPGPAELRPRLPAPAAGRGDARRDRPGDGDHRGFLGPAPGHADDRSCPTSRSGRTSSTSSAARRARPPASASGPARRTSRRRCTCSTRATSRTRSALAQGRLAAPAQGQGRPTRRSSRSSTWPPSADRRRRPKPRRCSTTSRSSPTARPRFEDAFWAILNTKEFLFNH